VFDCGDAALNEYCSARHVGNNGAVWAADHGVILYTQTTTENCSISPRLQISVDFLLEGE